MTIHQERALSLFESGCQCAQSVFVALCDETGLEQEMALALSASFGGGIGRMRETCGALCGLLMALGTTFGRYDLGDGTAKDRHYRLVQYASARFKQQNGSVFCYQLLDIPHAAQIPVSAPRTEQFYHERPCIQAVLTAVDIFDELMQEHNNGTLEDKISPEAAAITTEYLNEHA